MPAHACAPSSPRPRLPLNSVVVIAGSTPRLGLVTGAASDGRTVDIAPLKTYVAELYVRAGGSDTYARAADVRAVASEYVAGQDGWIVLDAALDAARAEFQATSVGGDSVLVEAEEKRTLSEEALKRDRGFGFPKPTKAQAVLGGIGCVPLAALFYSGWSGARAGLGETQGFGSAVQTIWAVGTVGCLVLGGALLVYAAGLKEDSSK